MDDISERKLLTEMLGTLYTETVEKKLLASVPLFSDGITFSTASSRTLLVERYNYDLLDNLTQAFTAPSGYHFEFRVSAQAYTVGSGAVSIYLCSTKLFDIATWSPSYYRGIAFSGYFKRNDIPLETTTTDPNHTGVRLMYTSSASSGKIYDVTIHIYLVKD